MTHASESVFLWQKDLPQLFHSLPLEMRRSHWVFHVYICIRFVWNPTFLQLYSMYFCPRSVPCTTFCFCRKDKDKSFICSVNIYSTWIERDFLSDIFSKVQFIFKLNPNLNWLHIYKVFSVLFLYYSTFRCPQLLCAIWFCQFLYMLKLTPS